MATPPLRPAAAGGPPGRQPLADDAYLSGWKDPEAHALAWSYVIAIGLAILWLIVVHFYYVAPPSLLPKDEEPVTITVPPPTTTPAQPKAPEVAAAPQKGAAQRIVRAGPVNRPVGRTGPKGKPRMGRPGSRTETYSTGAISDAFGTGSGSGTGGLTGDVSGVLRGVAVASGSGGTGGGLGGRGGGGAGGKTVLGYGQGGEGGRTPGRGGFGGGNGTGGGGGGGGIGGVGAGGGITRAAVRVSAPRPVHEENLGGPGRDVGSLGEFVRSRESQLRFCYVEYGLKQNPGLAGTITVAISITGSGSVSGADITNRTWGGAGASEAESCIRSKIESWRVPTSAAGSGTYSFPFNFTK